MLDAIREYYETKLARHGATAKGVDWNSGESQEARFERLLTAVDRNRDFTLNDYGCGYGALAMYLAERDIGCSYHGYDISAEMVARGREWSAGSPDVRFSTDPAELPRADFTVASGLFNVKLDATDRDWTSYVLETLAEIAKVSRRAFAFNMLTAYGDPGRQRRDLYYGDPLFFFRHCQENYSRWVALLHDYGLYEFTLIVRRDERRSW